MALTTDEQAELDELRAARRRIIAGGGIKRVTSQGRTVEYSDANMGALEERIGRLEARASGRGGRAIGFRF